MDDKIFSALIPHATATVRKAIAETLEKFGFGAVHCALSGGVTVVPLPRGALYRELSPALARLGIDVDAWPAPPAGLFVIEERTVYLRSCSPMTVSHEFGHALDCILGGGVYRSTADPEIRAAFASVRSGITHYAMTGIDEYFAESVRAYVDNCNDPASAWPAATRERLRRLDPAMFCIVERIFERFSRS